MKIWKVEKKRREKGGCNVRMRSLVDEDIFRGKKEKEEK